MGSKPSSPLTPCPPTALTFCKSNGRGISKQTVCGRATMSNDCNDQISTQTQTQGNPLHSVPRGKSFVTYNLACNSTFNIVVSKTDDIKGASVFHHLMKTQMHLNPPPPLARPKHQPGAERRDRRRWRHQKRPSMRGERERGGVSTQWEEYMNNNGSDAPSPLLKHLNPCSQLTRSSHHSHRCTNTIPSRWHGVIGKAVNWGG